MFVAAGHPLRQAGDPSDGSRRSGGQRGSEGSGVEACLRQGGLGFFYLSGFSLWERWSEVSARTRASAGVLRSAITPWVVYQNPPRGAFMFHKSCGNLPVRLFPQICIVFLFGAWKP